MFFCSTKLFLHCRFPSLFLATSFHYYWSAACTLLCCADCGPKPQVVMPPQRAFETRKGLLKWSWWSLSFLLYVGFPSMSVSLSGNFKSHFYLINVHFLIFKNRSVRIRIFDIYARPFTIKGLKKMTNQRIRLGKKSKKISKNVFEIFDPLCMYVYYVNTTKNCCMVKLHFHKYTHYHFGHFSQQWKQIMRKNA